MLTAIEIGHRISEGTISAADYAEIVIKQEEICRELNSFIHFNADSLIETAKKIDQYYSNRKTLPLLFGVPIGVKANIDVEEMPTSAGTAALRNHMPNRTAPAVEALLKAGGIVAGKLNMHELAFGVTTNNDVFGTVKNPYNMKHIVGGSSGGNAAAISAGIIPAALGTDTGGSTRGPAALCGIVGMRPTTWRYPQGGVVPISHTRDTIGPMARKVEDLVFLDGLISGDALSIEAADTKKLRLGIPYPFYENLHPDIEQTMEQIFKTLVNLGITLIKLDMSDVVSMASEVSAPICFYEVIKDLPRYLNDTNASISLEDIIKEIGSPDVREIYEFLLDEGRVNEDEYYDVMTIKRPALKASYRRHFKKHQLDAIFFPTTRLPAPAIGDDLETVHNGETVSTFQTLVLNTDLAGNAGMPGVTIPAGLTQCGLPIGVELDGLPGSDRKLLAIATAIEKHLPSTPAPEFPFN